MSARRAVAGAAAALVLFAGLLTGCGAGGAAAGHGDPIATSTANGPHQPGVTTVSASTTTVATDLPGYGRPIVNLGDMNTPEQFVIGELYLVALEQQGYTVQLSPNIGDPTVRRAALNDGSLDLYPEYLGEWNSVMAHLHQRFQTLSASYGAGNTYAEAHGFELLKPTRFSDTWGLAVTSQYAKANHVRSIPDLTRGPGVLMGAPQQFETKADGLPALAQAYGLQILPESFRAIDVGEQYGALTSGEVDVAWVHTTDPQLAGPDFRELRDPKHVFGFGNVVPVTTPEVLQVEGPDFKRTIDRVDALLTTRAIRGLNAEYSHGTHDKVAIAEQFLEGNGVLPPSRYAPVTKTGAAT